MPKVVDHAERRKELIEASWDVISDIGIAGLTLRNVARAAGCTTGRISHYFSNREELLSSALRMAHKNAALRMMKIANGKLNAKERLILVSYEGLPLDKRRLREWKVWIVFWAAVASSQSLAQENADRYTDWQALVSRLLTESGVPGKRLESRLFELMSIIDGLGIRMTLTPTPKNRDIARKLIRDWVGQLD
ncbi:MAG: TetR family transcriptional regulator C-terminal domain-containing protein [Pseudomonadales bacterium]